MASSRSSCMSSLGLDEMERNALIQKLGKKFKKNKTQVSLITLMLGWNYAHDLVGI